MKFVMVFVPWLIAALGAIFGGAFVLYALVSGNLTAPADYAIAGSGLALTGYVLARAVQEMARLADEMDDHRE